MVCYNWISNVDDAETLVASKGEILVADQPKGGGDSAVDRSAVTNHQTDVFAISSSYGMLLLKPTRTYNQNP